MSGVFGILDVSASGLSAQRRKLNAVADNIANVETTNTPEGGPYRRKQVIFSEDNPGGTFIENLSNAAMELDRTDYRHFGNSEPNISVNNEIPAVESEEVRIEPESFKMIYDPTHPDADANGYVAMPDINIISEMVEMMTASRAYEANVSVTRAAKAMYKEALNI